MFHPTRFPWHPAVDKVMRRPRGSTRLFDREALAATALAGHIRIAEHKCGVQSLARKINFGAVDERHALAVHYESYPILLDHAVALAYLLGDFHDIGVTRAPGLAHAEAYADSTRLGGEKALHALARCWG